jgi:VanZ family protein
MLALAAGAVYAATDELHQYFVPSRQMDAVDWLVDLAGVLAGSVSALALERWRAGP